MTREELLGLMPQPRVDWENINEGNLLLVTSESDSEGVDYHWALTRVVKAEVGNDRSLIWCRIIASDPEGTANGVVPFHSGFDEQYWNLTEMSRQHLLPKEITTFVMEYQGKL